MIKAYHMVAIAAALVSTSASAETPAESVKARNAATIRAHHDAINRGDLDTAASHYAEQFTNNGVQIGRERVRAIMEDNARTFPDWTMRIDRLLAEGDQVVVLMTVSGTHRGVSRRPVNGGVYLNTPATGRAFSVLHTHWFTLKDGQIVEHRATRDDLGMSRQLGLLPPAPPRPPN